MIRLSLLTTSHHLIFQHQCVRASTRLYPRFTLLMVRSPVFASAAAYMPEGFAHFALAFAPAPPLKGLTMQTTVTRRIIIQKARDQARYNINAIPYALSPLVGIWFQVLWTPLTGVLFTFRSRYWFTIGHGGVFSLGGWAPLLHTRFHVSGTTRDHFRRSSSFVYRAVTFYGFPFQKIRLNKNFFTPLQVPEPC